jgi:hypothetical protein
VGVEALEHGGEVTAREAPVERSRRSVVAVLEAFEAMCQGGEVCEVGRLDDLALDDREDDLD